MRPQRRVPLTVTLVGAALVAAATALGVSALAPLLSSVTTAPNPDPPPTVVKLIFIHHSVGENWLADDFGGLGLALAGNNYFVSDTNYGWEGGGTDIGNRTDIGHWWEWFAGPNRSAITADLYAESEQHASYSRLATDPGGPNQIVMFKSCFPNSMLEGDPDDPPTAGANPLRGNSEPLTVGNAKGIYNDILGYFATRQDTLFVAVTAPPVQDATWAANARAFNTWLVNDWLASYPYANVAVFDHYNVLTSNGGDWDVNDLGQTSGNHHRWRNGAVEHVTDQGGDTAAYPNDGWDDHPSPAGARKAAAEFLPLLNIFYNRWKALPAPTPTPARTRPIRRHLSPAPQS
jgi:hypothetical protein